MQTDDQRFELCQLLAEPTQAYPRTEVDELRNIARTINVHAENLKTICPFNTLKSHSFIDLMNAEKIVNGLTYSERTSVRNVCEPAVKLASGISGALQFKFGIPTEGRVDLNLNRKCSRIAPFTNWGTVSDSMISEFDRVVSMDLSKKDIEVVCRILSTYLRERANQATELAADRNALNELDSIVRKHGNPACRASHAFLFSRLSFIKQRRT